MFAYLIELYPGEYKLSEDRGEAILAIKICGLKVKPLYLNNKYPQYQMCTDGLIREV